jgi:hypothetical protein
MPVPTEVPPQLPLYHFQLPPVPVLPPFTLSVVLLPTQIVLVPVTDVAALTVSLITTVRLLHGVVLQPCAALRYKVCVPVPKVAVVIFKVSALASHTAFTPPPVPGHTTLYHSQRALLPFLPPFGVNTSCALR